MKQNNVTKTVAERVAELLNKAYSEPKLLFHTGGIKMFLEDGKLPEESEESPRAAVRTAAAFDSDPIFTLENVILLSDAEKQGVYDETGATAMDGLNNTLEEYGDWIPDTFRKKARCVIEEAGR